VLPAKRALPDLAAEFLSGSGADRSSVELDQGGRIGVVGGGPAGSLFSYFLLKLAEDLDLDLELELFEPRDFVCCGPGGCNHCGGIVSESLVQLLATEGINLPTEIVKRGIDRYVLHMDEGSVAIETPFHEKRIAALYRGGGPRGSARPRGGLDAYLQELAVEQGAKLLRERVTGMPWKGGRPQIQTRTRTSDPYDLMVVAVGVNTGTLKLVEGIDFGYQRPETTKAFICEYLLGEETVNKHLGAAMHVFLLDIPRIEFAALIPKGDYMTLALLGEEIDKDLVSQFLSRPEVQSCLPGGATQPSCNCQCSPKMNVRAAKQPFTDRLVLIGDCGATRLYKDGIGAAYCTAKAAATTALFHGVSAADFERHYWKACRSIESDNRLGKLIFGATRVVQKRPEARRALLRMVRAEQRRPDGPQALSGVVWDLFTGSAPYRDVLRRSLNPGLVGRLAWNLAVAGLSRPARDH
jgi:flavin-dependent dehydrogenase